MLIPTCFAPSTSPFLFTYFYFLYSFPRSTGDRKDNPPLTYTLMGNQESRTVSESQAYNALAPRSGISLQPGGVSTTTSQNLINTNFPRNIIRRKERLCEGEARAGRSGNGNSAFERATQGNSAAIAGVSKTELFVFTQGGASRSMASLQGVGVAAGDSSAMVRTKRTRTSSSLSTHQSLRRKLSTSTALSAIGNAPGSLAQVSKQMSRRTGTITPSAPPLDNGLVASRGDVSAVINLAGEAEAVVASQIGSARIAKNKNEVFIESHGTGQAGRTGNTMWALDGENMAMAHLPSAESGGIFCPCSMRQDGVKCDCPCHGGVAVNHSQPAYYPYRNRYL